ncbi:unnamed protein product, partial [Vitis vinifera]
MYTYFASLVTLKIAARLIFIFCKFTKSQTMAPFFCNFPMGKSGGVAVWEPEGAEEWLERLNPSELFTNIVTEHEYVECTSSPIQTLLLFKKLYPNHRRKEVNNFIEKATHYVENVQRPDGSCMVAGEFASPMLHGLHYQVYMNNCMLHYVSYRNIFPTWALGMYRRRNLPMVYMVAEQMSYSWVALIVKLKKVAMHACEKVVRNELKMG